ncbi:MAG: vWA domain-containing protein [Methyloceanibacter sp.]|jgi:Ca-activated chloride channel family protein
MQDRGDERLMHWRNLFISGLALSILVGSVFVGGSLFVAKAENAEPESESKAPCTDDAMIVFDASGSMSGNQELGIPNSKPRIDEVRWALRQVLPSATRYRRVGLVTYGPGPYNQCNVSLAMKPTANAAKKIMRAVNRIIPAGKTPLTSGVEQAAEALDYRNTPGVIVVVTDGEETCGRAPCELAKQLHDNAAQLTVHVIAFRYAGYSWTGTQSIVDVMCLAEQNNGLLIKANSEQELADALEKTLDCPMISQAPPSFDPVR